MQMSLEIKEHFTSLGNIWMMDMQFLFKVRNLDLYIFVCDFLPLNIRMTEECMNNIVSESKQIRIGLAKFF